MNILQDESDHEQFVEVDHDYENKHEPTQNRKDNILDIGRNVANTAIHNFSELFDQTIQRNRYNINPYTGQKIKFAFLSSRTHKQAYIRLLIPQILLAIFSLISIIITIVSLQVIWDGKETHTSKVTEVLRGINSLITIAMLILIFYYWQIRATILSVQFHILGGMSFWEHTYYLEYFIIYSIITIPHCPPGLSYLIGEGSITGFLSIAIFMRMYFMYILLFHCSGYWQARDSLVRFAQGRVDVTSFVMLKTLFQLYTTATTLVLVFPQFFLLAYCVYISERTSSSEIFRRYPRCLWFVVITASTEGYGDTVPTSALGRILASVTIIWGFILVSMIIASLVKHFALTDIEDSVVKYHLYCQKVVRLQEVSVRIVQTAFRRHRWRIADGPKLDRESRWQKEVLWNRKLGKLIMQQKELQSSMFWDHFIYTDE